MNRMKSILIGVALLGIGHVAIAVEPLEMVNAIVIEAEDPDGA